MHNLHLVKGSRLALDAIPWPSRKHVPNDEPESKPFFLYVVCCQIPRFSYLKLD